MVTKKKKKNTDAAQYNILTEFSFCADNKNNKNGFDIPGGWLTIIKCI